MHEVRIPVSTSILSLPGVFTFIIYWLCHGEFNSFWSKLS